MTEKLYYSISEVAEILSLEAHVLRFWERKMHQIQPNRRSGGRRFYRADDIDILRYIQHLLHVQGFTIEGAQKKLKTLTKSQIVAIVQSGNLNHDEAPELPENQNKENAIELLLQAKSILSEINTIVKKSTN